MHRLTIHYPQHLDMIRDVINNIIGSEVSSHLPQLEFYNTHSCQNFRYNSNRRVKVGGGVVFGTDFVGTPFSEVHSSLLSVQELEVLVSDLTPCNVGKLCSLPPSPSFSA